MGVGNTKRFLQRRM